MKKAVLIFSHKDPVLLNTLIEQFLHNSPFTDIFIHLDKKSIGIKDSIKSHNNVFFIKNNVSVKWGNDTMMRSLFNSWEEIINNGKEYDYFIMCTGQDLLVKPEIDKFLESNKGKIWLETKKGISRELKCVLFSKLPRLACGDYAHKKRFNPLRIIRGLCFRLSTHKKLPQKKLSKRFKDLQFFNSYNWSIMPYNVLKWTFKHIKENKDLNNLYLHTYLPEDYFLGTMIMNSPFASEVVWKTGELWSCSPTFHYPFEVHPRIITLNDIADVESSGCIFARKFDSAKDQQVINYFKNKILNS